MRFLLFPFVLFAISFFLLRTSNIWSTKKNWKRIGLEVSVALGASLMFCLLFGIIVVFFN